MTKRMLIDAAHAEETRVVVVDGTRIEELDFESQSRKQLRGNIYLAKVTRVEPSLQAAFVEYGGNRHGFLAFNEIHPDYYQIPIADREALMREEADDEEDDHHHPAAEGDEENGGVDEDDVVEEQLERRRRRLMRRYKIQEVIKRRQIMLVQVVKEERGNKGAALTTYLSLAGRYCVLMPNTARGGGISRKITVAADRKRLKSAAQSLEVPQGMGLIIRTAGAARTKLEIKRDYEYLMRLWETIREATLKSIAPALIYEEEDLVKRAIRDMFDKDLEGIWVEGEAGYREARDFMRMIMPSQAKKIQLYKEPTPLFVKYKVEDQLAQIHSPIVQLRSGGYLVINQTEALVAVDVNSGKATRERNIEATALKTNMEAAEEASRQLRLRDLAGLIVIDFIDMDESKNNRAVEKKLKDCLKDDRARVQMGKISPFGLMEISRQRRRMGVLEGATHVCEHCQGQGRVRSIESAALAALRAIEIEAARNGAGSAIINLPSAVALYVLNEKRAYLGRLEQTHGLRVAIAVNDKLGRAEHEIERTSREEREPHELASFAPTEAIEAVIEEQFEYEEEVDEDEDEAEAAAAPVARAPRPETEDAGEGDGSRRPRRRRRRRGRRDEEGGERAPRVEGDVAVRSDDDETDEDEDEGAPSIGGAPDGGLDDEGARRRRRRRGRRGGRRTREETGPTDPYAWVHPHGGGEAPAPEHDPYAWSDPHDPRGPRPRRQQREARPDRAEDAVALAPSQPAAFDLIDAGEAPATVDVSTPDLAGEAPAETKAKRPRRSRAAAKTAAEPAVETDAEPVPEVAALMEADAKVAEAVAAPAPKARSRSRKTAVPALVDLEAVAEAPVETVAPAPTKAAKPARAPRRAASPAVEAAPAPVVEAEAPAPAPAPAPVLETVAAVAAPAVDPSEISTAPTAPKRGWWRRS
jgi:ribonuclease E